MKSDLAQINHYVIFLMVLLHAENVASVTCLSDLMA